MRYTVCKTIMKEITNEISHSFHHELTHIADEQFLVKSSPTKKYKVEFDGEKWRCVCDYEAKTGIFCSHVAKVVMSLKNDLLQYIHPRWKLNIERTD